MKVSEALNKRQSIRSFLDKEVDPKTIAKILQDAGKAPSGTNTQPWQVAVVTGDKKQQITQEMEATFRSGTRGKMDYQYYPKKWDEPYKSRRRACGLQMYNTLKIAREDKDKQLEQWAANYRAFDAPVLLFVFLDSVMVEKGSFLDCGMFVQSLMLMACENGLATCPQAALAEYPEIVKSSLGYPDDSVLLCGIALGYADEAALVNSYRTEREPLENFVKIFK